MQDKAVGFVCLVLPWAANEAIMQLNLKHNKSERGFYLGQKLCTAKPTKEEPKKSRTDRLLFKSYVLWIRTNASAVNVLNLRIFSSLQKLILTAFPSRKL